MFWYFVGICILAFLVFFFYMGFHKQVIIYEKNLDPMHFVYLDWTGTYQEVGRLFDRILQDSRACTAKDFVVGGIYYDNPDFVSDHTKERASLGMFINSSEKNEAEKFVQRFRDYKLGEIPSIKVRITSRFPYRNFFSFLWMRFTIYPSLFNQEVMKEICPTLSPYLLEFYPESKTIGRSIISAVPYEKDMKHLTFTQHEKPLPKGSDPNKKNN